MVPLIVYFNIIKLYSIRNNLEYLVSIDILIDKVKSVIETLIL